jgi:hypothetical protein
MHRWRGRPAAGRGAAVVAALALLGAFGGSAMAFTLSSPAFSPGADIPIKHTCDGADASPALTWADPPPGAATFALIVDDPDAPVGTWVHWVLFNIPGSTRALAEATPKTAELADGSRNGTNDFKRLGYGGPCPPRGPAHRYFFKLYALGRALDLKSGATKAQVLKALEGQVLGQAELMGRYRRK